VGCSFVIVVTISEQEGSANPPGSDSMSECLTPRFLRPLAFARGRNDREVEGTGCGVLPQDVMNHATLVVVTQVLI